MTYAIRVILLLLLSGGLAGGQFGLALADAPSLCVAASVGTDIANWNSNLLVANGHSRGETFVATDTLIQSITVWRYPQPDTNFTPMHLFITEFDSATDIPITWGTGILLDGPVLVVPYSDGVHPLPVRFDLNPPFALPHPGTYFFAVKENLCYGFFALAADTTDPYPEGQSFITSANYDCAGLGGTPGISNRFQDLIFTIEFCELAVPTRKATWGGVKAYYR
jgi:hypothetical protein